MEKTKAPEHDDALDDEDFLDDDSFLLDEEGGDAPTDLHCACEDDV